MQVENLGTSGYVAAVGEPRVRSSVTDRDAQQAIRPLAEFPHAMKAPKSSIEPPNEAMGR